MSLFVTGFEVMVPGYAAFAIILTNLVSIFIKNSCEKFNGNIKFAIPFLKTANLLSMPGNTVMTAQQKKITSILNQLKSDETIGVSVDCVIFGFDENELKVLLIKSDLDKFEGKWSLLGDLVNNHEDLNEAAYRILKERTGMNDVYLEEVKAFGEVGRHPAARVVTIAYCSLINIQHHQLKIHDNELHWHKVSSLSDMAFDHKRILNLCYEWLQKRIQEHPLGFSLLPKKFSLRELQNLYEAILSVKLDRRNFRKKFFTMGLLEDTKEYETDVPHRPGKLYKFNYDKYKKKERKKWFGIDF